MSSGNLVLAQAGQPPSVYRTTPTPARPGAVPSPPQPQIVQPQGTAPAVSNTPTPPVTVRPGVVQTERLPSQPSTNDIIFATLVALGASLVVGYLIHRTIMKTYARKGVDPLRASVFGGWVWATLFFLALFVAGGYLYWPWFALEIFMISYSVAAGVTTIFFIIALSISRRSLTRRRS